METLRRLANVGDFKMSPKSTQSKLGWQLPGIRMIIRIVPTDTEDMDKKTVERKEIHFDRLKPQSSKSSWMISSCVFSASVRGGGSAPWEVSTTLRGQNGREHTTSY